jgi:hypothetical protein
MATLVFIFTLLFSTLENDSNFINGDDTTTNSNSSVSERGDFIGQVDIHP